MVMAGGDARSGREVHVPVLRDEVVDVFRELFAAHEGWLVDGTLGAGGHAG